MGRPRKHDPADVLRNAMEVFWRKGFVATSMSDIYEATGLKPGNLYATFGDKDGLFRAVFEAYAEHFRATIPANAEGLAAIRAWLETQVRLATEDPERKGCLIVNTATEREAHSQATRDLARARLDEIRAFFLHHLSVAVGRGEMLASANIEKLADSLLGSIIAIMSMARGGLPTSAITNVSDEAFGTLVGRAKI